MNSNKLISIDDQDLENVAGGLEITISTKPLEKVLGGVLHAVGGAVKGLFGFITGTISIRH